MAVDHDTVAPTPAQIQSAAAVTQPGQSNNSQRFINVATLQNNPGAEPARGNVAPDPLTVDEVKQRLTKWQMYDKLFDKLKDDVLVLYEQFSVAEPKINPWLWPTDSYAKTQIYKAAHFLSLFYEARLREANDLLTVALRTMENERGGGKGAPDVDMEALD